MSPAGPALDRVQTVVVMAAGWVGSTAPGARVGRARFEELRREQESTLRDVAEAAGGRVVTRDADGFLIAFPSVGGALDGAVRLQQLLERRTRGSAAGASALRIAISMGDATVDEDQLSGIPPLEAQGLCGRAGAGEVLVADPVRTVLRVGGPHRLEDAGVLRLDGLLEPAQAWRLRWEPLPESEPVGPPLPPRLQTLPETHFVGRAAERGLLLGCWERAVAGQRQLAVISGEPGIGKTRLVTHLAQTALPDNALVLYGRCDADQGIPYHPWREILRDYGQVAPERLVRPYARELSRLVPGLARELGTAPASAPTDPDNDRYLLFSAVESLFAVAGESRPVLAILDDLHWADRSTLLLLTHLATASAAGRLMLVGTFRDSDVGEDSLLTASLRELEGQPGFARLALVGLDQGQIVDLIEELVGRPVDSAGRALAREVHRETAGNPFFVGEILRHLKETGVIGRQESGTSSFGGSLARHGLPQSVREVILRRLQRLSAEARRVLTVGAVIGTEFDGDLVARAADLPPARVAELLHEAISASLLTKSALTRPAITSDPAMAEGYAFSHGLVAATLRDAFPPGRRVALHLAVGEALEASARDQADLRLGSLAHHFLAAADGDRAVAYATRAGEQAMNQFAYEQAAALFSGALAVSGAGRGRRRMALLQALGDAQMRAGDSAAARRTLREAAEAARRYEDPEALARAVRSCGIWGLSLGVDRFLVGLAEEAIECLERWGARRLLAEIKGLLAAALYYAPAAEADRRERLAAEALAAARAERDQVGDRGSMETLVYVLGRYLLARWGPETATRDFGLADELLGLCRELGNGELELFALNWRNTMLGELGAFAELGRELDRMERMAAELRQPRAMVFLPLHRGMLAMAAGRFGEVERLNAESVEIGRRIAGSVSQLAASAQMVMLRLLQGRLPEIEAQVRGVVAVYPDLVPIRAALVVLLLQAGRTADARDAFERLVAPDLAALPRDHTHILSLALLADAAVALGDADRARDLYERLRPFSGRWVVVASDTALWPVDRTLGQLAAAIGSFALGRSHLAAARGAARPADAAPSLALIALDEARLLAARGGSEDREAALQQVGEALGLAGSLDMRHVVREAGVLQAQLADPRGGA